MTAFRGMQSIRPARQLILGVRQRRHSMRCVLFSAAVLFVVVSANAEPVPLPKDHKIAEPPVRFEGIDKLTDYAFCLHINEGDIGDPPRITMIELKDTNAFKLKFKTQ